MVILLGMSSIVGVVSLIRYFGSGLLPYPRYISSSLAPEWIEVRVRKELMIFSDSFLAL